MHFRDLCSRRELSFVKVAIRIYRGLNKGMSRLSISGFPRLYQKNKVCIQADWPVRPGPKPCTILILSPAH